MEVGFIGLGKMGSAMARNIAKAGHQVRAWNRSSNAGEASDALKIVASPSDAFQADVVFTMLSDDAAIREVLLSSNTLHGARAGVVHVVTSTISVDFADELRAKHAEAGVGYVAAPVFGRPDVAEAAQLNMVLPVRRGPSTRCVLYSMSLARKRGCSVRIQSRQTLPRSLAT